MCRWPANVAGYGSGERGSSNPWLCLKTTRDPVAPKTVKLLPMAYQVLARRLRPTGFDSLVGQDHVVRALTHALENDRVHHAYLFTGTRGVGKTTIARILAKCLNCETRGVSGSPCQTCSTCMDINEGRFIDLIEVDAASRTSVNDARELLDNAQYLPARGRYKVYLIDEVHMLSNSAFNALLKTLEEPPPHVKFLLATTEVKKVPVTVLSRCLQFQLKNVGADRIAGYLGGVLADEGVAAETAALELIARAARGSMRDALSITDQAIAFGQGSISAAAVGDMLGLVGRDETGALLGAVASGSAEQVLAITAEFAERAVDFATALSELASALHGLAVAQATGQHTGQYQPDHGLSPEAVQLFYQICIMGMRDLPLAPDPRSGAEMTLLRMLAFAPEPDSQVARSSSAKIPAQQFESVASRAEVADGASAAGHQTSGQAPLESEQARTDVQQVESRPGSAEASETSAKFDEASQPTDQPWHEMVAACPASGVTRMLLEHAVPAARDGSTLELLLDPRHDTLLSDAQQQAMARALAPFGVSAVRIRVESFAAESPAQRKERLAIEAQAQAEAAVAADPVVQSLLREFGGQVQRVIPNSTSGGVET